MYKYYSEDDLKEYMELPEGVEKTELFKAALFKLGLNTKSAEFEVQYNTHRNLKNQVVTCRRWIAPERTDRAWLRSGHASLEATIAGSSFAASDLKQMSRTLNTTAVLEQELSAN